MTKNVSELGFVEDQNSFFSVAKRSGVLLDSLHSVVTPWLSFEDFPVLIKFVFGGEQRIQRCYWTTKANTQGVNQYFSGKPVRDRGWG